MMNITIIPFLLEAIVPDNNHTNWNSVEYTFKLKKSTAIYTDKFENVTATIKCRPNQLFQRVSSVLFLFCEVQKIIISTLSEQTSGDDDIWEDIMEHKTDKTDFTPHIDIEEMPDRTFTLQFSTRRVQDFTVTGVKLESRLFDLASDIVEQFVMGIDLSTESNSMANENEMSGTHVISSLMHTNEKTIRASKCNTSLIIRYTALNHAHEDREYQDYKKKSNSDFYLKLLPISYTNPADKTFSIKRERMACRNQPKNIEFLNEKWIIKNYTEYYNVMELRRTKPKFTSHTHLEGYVLSRRKSIVHFREDVHLKLHRIKLDT